MLPTFGESQINEKVGRQFTKLATDKTRPMSSYEEFKANVNYQKISRETRYFFSVFKY
jgi:hypothetical protein